VQNNVRLNTSQQSLQQSLQQKQKLAARTKARNMQDARCKMQDARIATSRATHSRQQAQVNLLTQSACCRAVDTKTCTIASF
jgi:hypothetical protein